MPYPDKFVHQAGDIPDVEHWAIFQTDGVFIPGDERSRTNPGHGYPAETRNFISYHAYLTKEKLVQTITELEQEKKTYKLAKITPIKVMKTVSIELKEKDLPKNGKCDY